MAKIKLAKTAVEAAQPTNCDVELRDTVVPGFLCKVISRTKPLVRLILNRIGRRLTESPEGSDGIGHRGCQAAP